MSGVLLPIRLCSPTVQELKHRRVVGQALEVDSDSDNSESESSDDSAANEYAEGLGFADRRREAVSNFEFDHHPRKEYFEEPKSWDGDVGRCSMQPVRESKRPISSVLRDLEAQEERELKRARQSLRGQAAQGAMPQMQTSSRGKEHWAELRAYGACLALLRQRFHREGLKEGWELEALRVLKALGSFKIGVSELQSTGLGREVSKSVWQKNRSREVSRLSRRLLKDWRRSAGLPSLRRRSANHANSNLSISSRVGRETS